MYYSIALNICHYSFLSLANPASIFFCPEDSARDYMVTVEFAEYGQKKMLAGFARLNSCSISYLHLPSC